MRTMNSRRARRAVAGATLACAALLMTACGSTASSVTGLSASASSQGGPASPPGLATARTATRVLLAEGQDIHGTVVYKPACHSGCALSGDSTAFLDKMTWPRWSAAKAVGKGIYELNGCNPNCAAGHIYHVPVVVTLDHPVKVCSSRGTRWFWSRASFRFPKGLPKGLHGDSAPVNPWTFSGVITAAKHSCRG